MQIVSISINSFQFSSFWKSKSLVDFAVVVAHEAIFHNAAQNCIAGSRTFVHSKIYDEFIAKSVALAKKRIVGDPFDSNTQQGPQVDFIQVFFSL